MSPAVLLVDDELICRDPLTRLLRLQGMDVTAAADGIEALRTLRGIRPGVMVLDLALPRLSGFVSIERSKCCARPFSGPVK